MQRTKIDSSDDKQSGILQSGIGAKHSASAIDRHVDANRLVAIQGRRMAAFGL